MRKEICGAVCNTYVCHRREREARDLHIICNALATQPAGLCLPYPRLQN
jgi:hypothetical protein